jgi:hypothetical protein
MEVESLRAFVDHPERDLALVADHDCRLLAQADEPVPAGAVRAADGADA